MSRKLQCTKPVLAKYAEPEMLSNSEPVSQTESQSHRTQCDPQVRQRDGLTALCVKVDICVTSLLCVTIKS